MAGENGKEDKDKTGFPMIPESNWWNIRKQFSKTLPSNVSVNYLKTLLSLTTDQAAKNLISPLKTLLIINDDGSPTELANAWRNDSSYSDACQTMLKSTYPQELLDLFPDKDFDRFKVKDWFKTTGKLGESAANKATSLFGILKTAEIKYDSGATQTVAKSSKPRRSKKIAENTESVVVQEENETTIPDISISPKNSPQMTMHIDLQIHISPEASTDQIDAIFSSMAKYLYK